MAKKDKAAKPGKAGKIPKQIGGVKLSKALRKSGEKLIERAQSPQGRQVIAAGLAMASAAVARAKANTATGSVPPVPPVSPVPPHAPVPPVPPVPPQGAGSNAGGTPMVDPHQIVEAVGQAATAFIDGLFGRKR